MIHWPWQHEQRDDSAYTDAIVAALTARADGATLALPSATAALESCAGLTGRSFAAAEVSGRAVLTDALTPDVLEMIGRSLIRQGQLVMLISTEGGVLRLTPASEHDVEGGPDPSGWEYRLTLAGPSETLTIENVPASSVLHFKYAADAARPWLGNSPLDVAQLGGRLSAETVAQLGNESSGPVGRLLGIPKDGDDETVASLKADIRSAAGRVALLETGDWDAVGSAKVILRSERFGAEPPQSLVNLHMVASAEVMGACGFNPALFGAGGSAGTREAWRLCLFSVLSPLGRKVETELTAKLEDDVKIGWGELRASDLAGRARAFVQMVTAGKSLEEASAIAGLMVPED